MLGTKIGPYELLELLGSGGMASVYLARQESMKRFVAVKVIHRSISLDRTAFDRFEREAQVVARLEHPHILPVYDYDGAHDPPYIVMRYMPTGTLKDILERAHLPLPDIVHIFRQLASALDYAHRQGVVHRDIKPSNIMIDADGNVFITDFGIARIAEGGEHLTASGTAVGTPGYMAPEQGLGVEIDGRADVYSLGVMLYEMLTGNLPYRADTPMAILLKHINDPIPSARAVNPQISPELDEIIQKALSKSPETRYRSGDALASDLTALLQGNIGKPRDLQDAALATITELQRIRKESATQATITPSKPGAAPQRTRPGAIGNPTEIVAEVPARRRAGLWIVGALVALLVVAGVALIALGLGSEDADEGGEQEIVEVGAETATLYALNTALSITQTAQGIVTGIEETEAARVTGTAESLNATRETVSGTGTAIALAPPTTSPEGDSTPVPQADTATVTPTEAPTLTETPSITPTPDPNVRALVQTARGTVYTEPDLRSEVLFEAPQGTRLLIVGQTENGRWIQVDFQGLVGWILPELVEITGSLAEVPVVISPTPTPSLTETATLPPTATETPTPTLTPTSAVIESPTVPPPTDTPIPTVTPIPAGSLPFVADMEAANSLEDWAYVPEQWLLQTDGGNQALYGTTGLDSTLTVLGNTVPQWVNPSTDDLLMTFRVNLLENNSGSRFIFKFEPNSGYYVLEMFSGLMLLKRGQAGIAPNRSTERDLGRLSGAPITSGRWYEISVWVESSRVFIYLEKELVIEVDDRSVPLAPGAIMLQTVSTNNEVGWDDLVVQEPELASEHFEGSTFPNTWARSSQQNVQLGTQGHNSQYIEMLNAAEVSPNTPPLGNFILFARLNNTAVSFAMSIRESGEAGLHMDWDAGNVQVTQTNSIGEVVWQTELRNFYARSRFEEFVMTAVGERIIIYKGGEIILDENLAGLPPTGLIRFQTEDGDGLRIDDFLVAETELTSTIDAEFAFEVLNDLANRPMRELRWDWEEDFTDRFRTRGWWEGDLEGDPGQYILDESVAFDADHRRYYTMQSGEFGVFRRIRPEIDSTRTVFGNGDDTATFRDSVDIYIRVDMRLPAENPAGAEAWVGVRSEANPSGGLYQYRVGLVRADNGDTLVRISPQTLTNRSVIYETTIDTPPDVWYEIIIVALDDKIAFFGNGRLLTVIQDTELLSGTLALGVEPNTLGHFDDLLIRDTSVGE